MLEKILRRLIVKIKKVDSLYDLKRTNFKEHEHRKYIGGMWDEVGSLQFQFLLAKGLEPGHKFIDVGCGSLRGGVKFIQYLDPSNYFGTDINEHLIRKGLETELPEDVRAKVDDRSFVVSDDFSFDFDVDRFDFGIAFSLFTHLSEEKIILCLKKLRPKFSGGKFYGTFFESSAEEYDTVVVHENGVKTYSNKDPFHYTIGQIEHMAEASGWSVNWIGEFNHPRNQKMAEFF